MRRSHKILASAAFFITPVAFAAECSRPPVTHSNQAMCYAVAYAEKHQLSHGRAFKKTVAKGQKVWTVRFLNDRERVRERGWEVDVDVKTGNVLRFTSYRPVPPTKG